MTSSTRRDFIKQISRATACMLVSFPIVKISNFNTMQSNNNFEVIIVGGSYAGLSAAMALGRALKKVLVIDNGKPCNRQTPYSHNFLTNDGRKPAEIAALASLQVSRYDTVRFFNGAAINGIKTENGFQIESASGESFTTKKLIFATGIKDLLPAIDGLSECWGISVIHCPYCHGYEIRDEKTGIFGNGDMGFDFTRLISNWTKNLTLFTNGTSTLSSEQQEKLNTHQIKIVEKEIEQFDHNSGQIQQIVFKDGTKTSIKAIYAPSPFEQHCKIPEAMGCELTDEGYLKIDKMQETTIKGVFAIGDNAAKMRTVANAVAMGTTAGMTISKQMILNNF